MVMPFQVIKELYDANTQQDGRVFVNQGGTSSGKTYTIIQVLFVIAMQEARSVITIVGQDLPNLKVGALRDAKTIINASEWMQGYFSVHDGASQITAANGSIIEFKSYENEQDAKSGKRDYLFINEANGITYQVYWQLAMRTRKRVFIDYNPSARFWVHDEVLGREGVNLIISDHRGNPFLTAEEHERIEGITDPELWKVYARGLTGKITGVVLTNWDIVDVLPPKDEWKQQGYGLDFGFTCFRGDTLIMTSKGEIPIKDVKQGDYVLTRKGYRKVKRNIYNGYKKTIRRKCVKDLRMCEFFCTFEHLFNCNGKWKKYGELTARDKLCMLSSSMAWSLGDTQTGNTQTTIITSGRKKENTKAFCYITRFMKGRTGKYPTGWLSITRTLTHLTIASKISLRLLRRNIQRYTETLQSGIRAIPRKCASVITQKITGNSEGRKFWLNWRMKNECVNTAEKSTHQQTRINVSAEKGVTTDGNIQPKKTTSNLFVRIAEKLSWVINTSNRNVAAMNVRTNWQYPDEWITGEEMWCEVYDLEVEDVHEYFANGILVHNCDPTALEHVILAHGDLWVDEVIYSTGLTNPDIVTIAKRAGITRGDLIVADSAEPKSIQEIHNGGLWCVPTQKGRDSISVGLDILRRYRIHFTRRSVGIIDNAKTYQWRRDRDGRQTNTPEDGNDHGIDAIRYYALMKLNTRRQTSGSRAKVMAYD